MGQQNSCMTLIGVHSTMHTCSVYMTFQSSCIILYFCLYILQSKVNGIVGSECLYCGDRMIETIDRPFIPPDQMTAALASWK